MPRDSEYQDMGSWVAHSPFMAVYLNYRHSDKGRISLWNVIA